MPGKRTKLRILLSVVALTQILTIPVSSEQSTVSIPTTISNEDGSERVSPANTPHQAHRKQRIKRARAANRAAVDISIMAYSCKIVAHSAA